MMPMSATPRRHRKPRHDHIRPEFSDHAHYVPQHLRLVPEAQRLLRVFRKSEIDRPRKKLPPAIEPTRCEQLLRPRHPEFLVELRAEQILPTIAARHRKITRP